MKRKLSEIIAEIEIYLDECEENPAPPNEYFKDLKGELAGKVDNWVDYLEGLEVLLSHMQEKKDFYAKKVSALKKLQENKEGYLIHCLQMTNMPELKSADNRIYLQRNPNPKLNFTIPVRPSSYAHILDGHRVDLPTEYPEFFQSVMFWAVDHEAVKSSLKAGRKLNFAELKYGQHLKY